LKQVSGEGGSGVGSAVIGTPDEMINMIRHLQEVTRGFGVLLGFAHDWAGREATLRSWELFARHVVPELNGYTRNLKASAEYLAEHRSELADGMIQSVKAAVGEDKIAQAALAITMAKRSGAR
jgi:limonene 1,2-monooxygenase